MAKDDPHFRLRLPAELKAVIEDSAKQNNRSINAEIVSRLEDSTLVRNGVLEALEIAERSLKREKESVDVFRWYSEQMKMTQGLLEMVAATDGTLDKPLLDIIRYALDNRGKNTGFPKSDDD